jgi:hypothetical protein
VRFVGEISPEVRAELSVAGIEHLLEVTGLVPHDEAMRLLSASSMLFMSGGLGSDPVSRGWIPAKLFEYLPTGLPIMLLGDTASDPAAVLSEHVGCYVMESTDVEAIAAALKRGLHEGVHHRSVQHLTRRARARTLGATLDLMSDRDGAAERSH